MCKISVIIPVYNCEAFLTRCLDSLLAQSHPDWEAVCVNDGSKDGSAGILDRYAEADKRFKVIHKENGGVSQARNLALEKADGKYILFVDSDDFLHPQTMEICLHFAEKDHSDLVAFTYDRGYRTRTMLKHILGLPERRRVGYKKYDIGTIERCLSEDIFEWATEYSRPEPGQSGRWLVKHCQPWRCLYRADRIRSIEFIKGIIYEDFPWWGEVLLNTRKASIINLPLYFYYPNKGSYIASARQQYRIRSLKTAIEASERLYAMKADDRQKELWERKFMVPFRHKLEKKVRKYGEIPA